ncbi:MAG TPA: DUF3047 domain-containing protein [Nitrospira sp.]|nr:DUF3047 domain-containing protein [Nitrospira sp.]
MGGRTYLSSMALCGVLVAGCSAVPAASAQVGPVIEVAKFSGATLGQTVPDGWKPLSFKKIPRSTKYEVVKDGNKTVVRADSDVSASGLTKEVKINPREYPIIRWSWKINNLVQKSDATRKDGDDYPARVYVTFEYDPDKVSVGKKLKYKAGQLLFGDIPIGAISYVWETKAPVSAILDNAYTDFVKMIVVQSGPNNVGLWIDESRNIYEDYKKAFGEEPPMINGVAIMSDTDNTKERAVAYYGDIVFVKGTP